MSELVTGPVVTDPVPRREPRRPAPRASAATLLVFTLGAARESRRRRLLPAALGETERALHEDCLRSVLAAGLAAGCRLLVSSPRRIRLPEQGRCLGQTGEGFGERLTQAIERAFAETEDRPVLVVGTDSPDLSATHLRRALALLGDDPRAVVLGPSTDGGCYLLAAHSPLHTALAGVRWRRRDTLDSLRRALTAAGRRVHLLEPLADLDRPADLERWLAAKRRFEPCRRSAADLWSRWTSRLRRLLMPLKRPLDVPVDQPLSTARLSPAAPRGPPLSLRST